MKIYATCDFLCYFKINGEWKMIKESRMDSVIVIKDGEPVVTEPRRVEEGDEVVVSGIAREQHLQIKSVTRAKD
mgnify:CR=1 FL=1